MSKAANLRHKSKKTPVLLYRAFLKLSLAGAVYAAFLVLTGALVTETGLAVFVAIVGAIAYEITYFVYKSKSKAETDVYKDSTWKQVIVLTKLSLYLAGLFLVILGSLEVKGSRLMGIAIIFVGLALCQQIHNNKKIFSHLSTFCENTAAGFIVITLELIYRHIGLGAYKWMWAISAGMTLLLYALTEVFFYFYNKGKHTGKASMGQLLLDRLAQFLRNILVAAVLFTVWVLLIISGCVSFVINLGIYDKAIAIIPIVISVAVPAFDIQNANSERKKGMIKYDPRIPIADFRRELMTSFGERAYSVKALEYVTENMGKKNGFTRDNGEDYFVHPIAVAKILLDNTVADDNTVAAALLHDCIEDIEGCTYEQIKREYNEVIADYVLRVTKTDGLDYHVHDVMREYIQNICDSIPATMIKIADRMNNNSTMDNRTEADKAEKTKETKAYFKLLVYSAMPHDSANRQFYRMAEEFFEQNIE